MSHIPFLPSTRPSHPPVRTTGANPDFSKIRCCGGKPCRNCDKAGKTCDYEPVPEEVNRATREKKAASKAARQSYTPTTNYASFFMPMNVGYALDYGVPTLVPNSVAGPAPGPLPALLAPAPLAPGSRPMHLGHRRSVSTPNFDGYASWTKPPAAPHLASPPMFDSAPQWVPQCNDMTPQTAPLSYMPTVDQTQPIYRAEPGQLPSAYSTPNLQQFQFQPQGHLRAPYPLTPLTTNGRSNTTSTSTSQSSPATPAPAYYAANGNDNSHPANGTGSYPTPGWSPVPLMPMHQTGKQVSPTLAPEYSISGGIKPDVTLVGLGIGMGGPAPAPAPPTQRHDLSSSISDMNLGLGMVDDQYFNSIY